MIADIIEKIKEENKEFTDKGWQPICKVDKKAKIVIVGQAPGIKTQLKEDVFRDASGVRLQEWLGIDEDTFYNSKEVAVLPMDFYYPGKDTVGDKPPRKEFASKWHPLLLEQMPEVELIILLGSYANAYYRESKDTLTALIKSCNYEQDKMITLIHPSPLNNRWLAKNKWFELEIIPQIQARVKKVLK